MLNTSKNMTPIFFANQKNGELQIEQAQEFKSHVHSLGEKRLEVTVKPYKKNRSRNQNKYLWGVVYKIISEHTGEDQDDLHYHFKNKFLETKGKSGKLKSSKSTKKLSTIEFEEYIDKIVRWAASWDCQIPSPNEIDYSL